MAETSKKTYRRDDGTLMVEIRPGYFVNEHVAKAGLAAQKPEGGVSRRNPATKRRGSKTAREA
jgi:hypothetical protein